jgi:hypothetical protein
VKLPYTSDIPFIALDEAASIGRNRISLSAGTRLVEPTAERDLRYDRRAFVPQTPWRSAAYDEVAAVSETSNAERNFVAVARVPAHLLRPLNEEALVAYLMARFHGASSPILHGVATNLPGLATVTMDPASGLFIGLHLDNWDKLPLSKRHMSLNRISVNIGAEPRWLLYLNASVAAMANALESRRRLASDFESAPQNVSPTYLRVFSDHPVVRVLVNPAEAYIAPTDNMIHDGSTLNAAGCGNHFTIRGRFLPG